MKYIVTANPKGEELFFTGSKFTTQGEPRKFPNRAAARRAATYLIGRHPVLANARVAVRTTVSNPSKRPMPKARKNPSGYGRAVEGYTADLDRADDLLEQFSGTRSKEILRASKTPIKAGLVVGKLEGVMYSTDRGDGTEKFFHRFRRKSRPLLIADSDGSQLDIVGGRYEFTDKGIEDR